MTRKRKVAIPKSTPTVECLSKRRRSGVSYAETPETPPPPKSKKDNKKKGGRRGKSPSPSPTPSPSLSPSPPPVTTRRGQYAKKQTAKKPPTTKVEPSTTKGKGKNSKKAKREPSTPPESPTPSPSPSPPPSPPAPKTRTTRKSAAAVAAEAKEAQKKNNKNNGKAEKKKPTLVPDLFKLPTRRSCFADTTQNNKWNFGPMASLNRRRRNEVMENYLQHQEPATSQCNVKKSYKKGTIKYEMGVVHPFVVCRLCNGYLIDATTIIDCMHTFCKSCLLLYFEDDETTCPTCGILIHGSHPAQYVTYDRAINDLVMRLVPNLEENEKQNRKNFLNSLRKSRGIDYEAEERAKAARKEAERVTGTNRCYRGDPMLSHHRDDNQLVVKLIPGTPNLPLANRPFIRTSEMTTINSLKKYLALQLWDDLNRYMDLDIFCDNQLMGKDFSIRFVWMMKRRSQPRNIPLELHFKMADHVAL